MIRCDKCGFENNDGSQFCLNCHEQLTADNRPLSNSERYIYINQEAIASVQEKTQKTRKTALTICVVFVLVLVVAFVIYLTNLYTPVIDERIVGSWEQPGFGNSILAVWTFKSDDSCVLNFPTSGMGNSGSVAYYRAENNVLKMSSSRNMNNSHMVYKYFFGVTESGSECLILEQTTAGTGTTKNILYKVR